MKYKLYAQMVLIFHVVIFLFLLGSLPLSILFDWYGWVVGTLLFLTLIQWKLFKGKCIFTIIENYFRRKSNQEAYNNSCIAHYLDQWFSIKVTTKSVDMFLYFYFALIILSILIKNIIY